MRSSSTASRSSAIWIPLADGDGIATPVMKQSGRRKVPGRVPGWVLRRFLDRVPRGLGDVPPPRRRGPPDVPAGQLLGLPPRVLLGPMIVPAGRIPVAEACPAARFVRNVVLEVGVEGDLVLPTVDGQCPGAGAAGRAVAAGPGEREGGSGSVAFPASGVPGAALWYWPGAGMPVGVPVPVGRRHAPGRLRVRSGGVGQVAGQPGVDGIWRCGRGRRW